MIETKYCKCGEAVMVVRGSADLERNGYYQFSDGNSKRDWCCNCGRILRHDDLLELGELPIEREKKPMSMLQISCDESPTPPIAKQYPCVKKSVSSGKIILFTSEKQGFILHSEHGDELCSGQIFNEENFKPWRGTITIRQD